MGTVSQHNLAHVQAMLGGANPISLSEYYRGGAYVPTTRAVTEGPFYSFTGTNIYYWQLSEYYDYTGVAWNQSDQDKSFTWAWLINPDLINLTSYTSGGYTYTRGALMRETGSVWKTRSYEVSRTSTITANTGVPSSGPISISQLIGAANP